MTRDEQAGTSIPFDRNRPLERHEQVTAIVSTKRLGSVESPPVNHKLLARYQSMDVPNVRRFWLLDGDGPDFKIDYPE